MSGEDFPVSAWSEFICHWRKDTVAGKERRDLEGKDISSISYSTHGPILLKQKLEPAGWCWLMTAVALPQILRGLTFNIILKTFLIDFQMHPWWHHILETERNSLMCKETPLALGSVCCLTCLCRTSPSLLFFLNIFWYYIFYILLNALQGFLSC